MRHWFTRASAPVDKRFLKRFDADHWTVDFPRGSMASLVSAPRELTVHARFLRKGDLVGLIWNSEDVGAHPSQARDTARDYSGVRLSFRWRSSGVMALDAMNGPTLTIEGRDAEGAARSWYVRLWNYASGSPSGAGCGRGEVTGQLGDEQALVVARPNDAAPAAAFPGVVAGNAARGGRRRRPLAGR